MSELEEILSDEICLLWSGGLGVDTIQGEPDVTWRDETVSKKIALMANYYQEYQI